MKLVTFRDKLGRDRVGIWTANDRIVDLKVAAESSGLTDTSVFGSMMSLIEGGESALAKARAFDSNPPPKSLHSLSSVKLLAPIALPPRMRAVSFFPRHLKQAAIGYARMVAKSAPDPEAAFKAASAATPQDSAAYFERPVYWAMDNFSVSGPDDEVQWPHYSKWIDYELELAAILGRRGKDISKEDAESYIFGYTILNDLSARDEQMQVVATKFSITAKGKDFDGSYAMGPCIVTADSIDIFNVCTRLCVNGEEWGNGHSGERHWTFADAIAYMSQSSVMVPGEVISSATVPNCAGMESERMGQIGDVVELTVEGIGTLRTKIV